jgi:imidazoleglycerol-phosphate dehydratase/histidinol-phosphatase
MPAEMIVHFFRSFCDHAKCNISVRAEGLNDHHKAEAIFKAFARAVRQATAKSGSNELPTTKGII